MEIIGIICEYNPFHNGHLYHIRKIKELFPNSLIIACVSGSFTQRGDVSILNKWDKTKIAMEYGVDLVVELPFVFATQSADIFAHGAMQILNQLKIEKLVFGSESDDIGKIIDSAKGQINDKDLKKKVKSYLDKGFNYPTALSKASGNDIVEPNDILAICYMKEIMKYKYMIEPVTIKRTNSYHDKSLKGKIASASAIRNAFLHNRLVYKYLPRGVRGKLYRLDDTYFNQLKYKIISNSYILDTFNGVDEGLENRILKVIDDSNSFEELIFNIKSKRYTYSKIKRMLLAIYTSFTKKDARRLAKVGYIRVLGFNNRGRRYLNRIKKEISVPVVTKYRPDIHRNLDLEFRITRLYSEIVKDDELVKMELKKPIIKK